jgi:hypothetical protein
MTFLIEILWNVIESFSDAPAQYEDFKFIRSGIEDFFDKVKKSLDMKQIQPIY